MKEDLHKKMVDYAKNGNKEIFTNKDMEATSIPDRCADKYYSCFDDLPDYMRKKFSCDMLSTLFRKMVMPAIEEARRLDRECREDNMSLLLTNYSDLNLLNELIKRNGINEAPRLTKRHGEWCEVLVAAGNDEIISICFPDEAIEAICKQK